MLLHKIEVLDEDIVSMLNAYKLARMTKQH